MKTKYNQSRIIANLFYNIDSVCLTGYTKIKLSKTDFQMQFRQPLIYYFSENEQTMNKYRKPYVKELIQ